jgi:HEAT repeat protein
MLNCAASLLLAGQAEQAAAVFEELSAADQPRHIRLAAFPGLVACRKGNSADLVLAALTGKDPSMQVAAVQAARAAAGDAKLAAALVAQLPKAAPPLRVMLIELLAAQGAKDALAEVTKQARAEDPAVRQAAIAALGALGDAGTVELLAALAAEAKGPERDAARGSLVRLKGKDIDAAMLALLKKTGPPQRVELIAALRERGATAAVGALIEAAADADPAVRAEAVKALGKLGDAATCPALIALLAKAEADADRYAVQQAIVAVCRRAAAGETGGASGAKPVLDALRGADAVHSEPLLGVLAALGGADSLDAIRAAAKSPDEALRTAAIRALADWPDAAPLEELLAMAKAADKPLPRILALRGLAKLAAKAADRKPADLVKLLGEAIALADRPEDKKALLGALGGVADPAALELAVSHLQTPALAGEAGLAVAKIAAGTWKTHPKPTRAALDQVMAAKVTPAVQAEAARILVELSRPRNLALGATATSPDGWVKDGAAGGDEAAIDGDPETYWDKEDGKDLYRLVVTFKQPEEVAVLRITGYQHHNFAPKDFDVLADGKVVKTVRAAQYDENHLTVAFPPVRCQAVELKITGYYGGSPAVRELEIYGPTPATAPAAK